MLPPTSRESSLSSAPMYALPPMSKSFSSVRLPDTRKSPPTSTSTPFPFPLIDAMPPTSRELNERSALTSSPPPTSKSSARAFPPILKALSTATLVASRDPSIASCPSSTFTSPLALRSPSILTFPWRAENSEHDRLPRNSASPSHDTRPVTWITLSSDSILASWPTFRSPSTWPSLDVAPLATETSPILWRPLSSSQSQVVCCKPVPSGCLLYSLLVYFDVTHFSSIGLCLAAAYNGRARRMVTRSDYKQKFGKMQNGEPRLIVDQRGCLVNLGQQTRLR